MAFSLPSRLPRRSLPAILLLAALLCAKAFAANGDEALNYYALIGLSDKAVGERLAARFKARGQPVFLIHDLNAGLGQNDIMRFADKAVLVDGNVWSTLQAEGALEKLQTAPLVRVQGQVRDQSWEQRANLVSGDRQKKAFKLGAEFLRVLEENFGGTPNGNQLTVVFSQGHLTLLAPDALLDQLKFASVRKIPPGGKPRVVSAPPDSNRFTAQPFDFQVWGADPSDPSGELAYQIRGALPPGLAWVPEEHALRGTPTAAGAWRLTAEVRNSQGLRDTLGFTLRFRVNQPPSLPGAPRAVAVVGHEWRFDLQPSDPDHPAYALKVKPGILPRGMTFNPDSLFLRWIPDTSEAGMRPAFAVSVEDPLGAKRDYRYTVQVLAKQENLLTEGITIELPWDTLVRGREYLWKTRALSAAWAGQGIRLLNIEGPDTTVFSGDTLRLRPMETGFHRLDFKFFAQGNPLTQSVTLPVREDHPPEFVTELTDWTAKHDDPPRSYRPVAIDPEGEPVTLSARLPAESPLQWDGKRIAFSPENPGVHPALITASDPGGKTAEQWIAFRSEPPEAGTRWIFENRVMGEFTTWSAAADFGTGRIGFYSPNFTYGLVPYSHWIYKEPPFLFVGGNLMGRDSEKKGRYLWADLGFTIRHPGKRVFTGGLYTRLNGEWHFPSSPLSWVEMEFTGQVHQLMVATDTTGLWLLLADSTELHNIVQHKIVNKALLSDVLRDAFQPDNAILFSRMEALGALGSGFYAGPSLWRQDNLILQQHVQRFGGALRYRYKQDSDRYQATVRVGWGPGGSGWGAYGTANVALGRHF